jgi:hypothetical protein
MKLFLSCTCRTSSAAHSRRPAGAPARPCRS